MPPKKGKATAKAVATQAATPRQTRGKQADVPSSSASARLKRNITAADVSEEPALKKTRTVVKYAPAQIEKTVDVESFVAVPERGRGRPPAKKTEEAVVDPETVNEVEEKPAPKKKGRPVKKVEEEVAESEEVEKNVQPTPKRGRGRPSLKKTQEEAAEPEIVQPTPKRGRGRPSLNKAETEPTSKKRGRPSKATKTDEVMEEADFDDADEENDAAEEEQEAEPAGQKRGRPSRASKAEEIREQADFDDADSNEEEVEEEAEPQSSPQKKRGRPAKNKVNEPPADDDVEEPPAKRGRKAKPETKQEEFKEPVKKRGRPAKKEQEESLEEQPALKKRGRPARASAEVTPPSKPAQTPRRRGRPAKAAADVESEVETGPPAKKRGRPAKADVAPTKAVSKPRERPAKAAVETAKSAPKKRGRPVKAAVDDAADEEDDSEPEPKAKKPVRGRPTKASTAKKSGKGKAVADVDEDEEADTSNEINPTEATTEIAPSEASGRQYWLMKAEPESRLERTASGKTVDVKFSIDDLAAKSSPEPWDGIRNAVASNNMRAMTPGDLAFFYESNCKVPGIVGIMEIVKEADVDLSAFDKESAYYDAKSNPSKPRWMNAYVEFRRKFSKISLKKLQSHGQNGGELEGMDLLRLSRLSVSKVSASQWSFIMSLVDEAEDESTITIAGASGSATKATARSSKQARSPASASKALPATTSGPEAAEDDHEADFASAFEAPTTLSSSPVKKAATYIGGIVEEVVEDVTDAAEEVVTSVAAGIAHNLGDQRDIDMVDVSHEHRHRHNNVNGEIETVAPDTSIASPSLTGGDAANTNEGNGTFDAIEFSSIKTRSPPPEDNPSNSILDTLKSTIGLPSQTASKTQTSGPDSRASSTAPTSAAAKVKDAVIAAADSLEQNVMEPGRERSKTQTSVQTAGEETFVTADGDGVAAHADTGAGARQSNGGDYEFAFGDESEVGNNNGDEDGVGDALARPLSYS